jgi:Domain of unknown function (DUF5753)/Helix-turn-helix domain
MPATNSGAVVSLRSCLLGERLRRLRHERGLSLRHAATLADTDLVQVQRHETGRLVFTVGQVAALLDVYQVHDQTVRDDLMRLAEAACGIFDGEGVDHRDSMPTTVSMVDYWWLETRAARIRCYGGMLLPESLQTPEYAAAAATAGRRAVTDSAAAHARRLCQRREQLLEGLSGGLHAVVTEQALHNPVGGPDVLRQQVKHLVQVCRSPHVQVQVLPGEPGRSEGTGEPFTLFHLRPPYPDLVAAAHHGDGPKLQQGRPARRHAATFDRLASTALSPAASIELITSTAADT